VPDNYAPEDAFLFSNNNRKVTPKEFIARAMLEGSALLFFALFGYLRRGKKPQN